MKIRFLGFSLVVCLCSTVITSSPLLAKEEESRNTQKSKVEETKSETKKSDCKDRYPHKSKLKLLTSTQLKKLMKSRVNVGIGGKFHQFANMFMMVSMRDLGKGVALMADNQKIATAYLEKAFPKSYEPTLRELLDAVALQSESRWVYEKRYQWVNSHKPCKKPLDHGIVIHFLPSTNILPYKMNVADKWKLIKRTNWNMYVPPGYPVGMDLHVLGRLPKTSDFDKAAREMALRRISSSKPKFTVDNLKTKKVGKYKAYFFEQNLPTNGKAKVRWREWHFAVGNQLLYVISTLPLQLDDKLYPDVKEMIATFRKVDAESVSRLFGLREFKDNLDIDLDVAQSRLFRITNNIKTTSVAAPVIAEPVVFCNNNFAIIGKSEGDTTLHLWDTAGGFVGINVSVKKRKSVQANLASVLSFYKRILPFGNRNIVSNSDSKDLGLKQVSLEKPEGFYKELLSKNTKESKKVEKFHDSSDQDSEEDKKMAKEFGFDISTEKKDRILFFEKHMVLHQYKKVRMPVIKSLNIGFNESRVFASKNEIVRTVIGDPSLSEPIIITPNSFILLGKDYGSSLIGFEDDKGNEIAIRVNVKKPSFFGRLFGNGKKDYVQPVSVDSLSLTEVKVRNKLSLEQSKCILYETNNNIVRVSVSDPRIVGSTTVSSKKMVLEGRACGKATLFIWDNNGGVEGFNVIVEKSKD